MDIAWLSTALLRNPPRDFLLPIAPLEIKRERKENKKKELHTQPRSQS